MRGLTLGLMLTLMLMQMQIVEIVGMVVMVVMVEVERHAKVVKVEGMQKRVP
jgi:hypothetical protein